MEYLVRALDTAIWELGEAFEGLPNDDVWVRAHPRLLSVGELAAHIAYGEASFFLGLDFESPFVNKAVNYYSNIVEAPFTLDLRASEVLAEVSRVHEESKENFIALNPQSKDKNPFRDGWTWEKALEYQVFHVAYHTGQIYSVRHLLGHDTVDN